MKTSYRWILYSLLRVGLFAAALVLLMLVGIELWLAAILATIIAFAVSYLFFRQPREALALDLQRRRSNPDDDADSEAENEAIDRLEDDRSGEPKPE